MAQAALVCAFSLFAFASSGFQTPQKPRDAAAPVVGTGTIAGVVLSDESTRQPVRRAIVTVSGSLLASSRSAITDDDGKFVIAQLPSGRFSIAVKKAAYIPGAYGATRPGRPGTPLSLAEGQRVDVTVKLARASVIAGVIRDPQGEPVPGVQVSALRIPSSGLLSSLFTTSDVIITDDRGAYRLFGLLPGEYVVAALPRTTGAGEIGSRSVAEMDAILSALERRIGRANFQPSSGPTTPVVIPQAPASFSYAPTYYPGATQFSGATRLTLTPGDERTGMDFIVAPITTATIEGAVTGAGNSLGSVQLSIQMDGPRLPMTFGSYPVLTERPGVTEQFKYTNVLPGHYTIMARVRPGETPATAPVVVGVGSGTGRGQAPPTPPDMLYAIAELDVAGADITGVTLSLQPAASVSGRVVFDSTTSSPPENLTKIRVTISLPGGTYMSSSGGTVIGNSFNGVPAVSVGKDGRFTASGIAPGSYLLRATLPADLSQNWWLQSAMVADRDLLDFPLEIVAGVDITSAVLTFADRRAGLSGMLQTPDGGPAPEYFVVVFPTDRTYWTPESRRLKSVRPGTDGRFSFTDLPAADYFLAALTDVDPDEWQKPAFLEQVIAGALRIKIAHGEQVTQDIRVRR